MSFFRSTPVEEDPVMIEEEEDKTNVLQEECDSLREQKDLLSSANVYLINSRKNLLSHVQTYYIWSSIIIVIYPFFTILTSIEISFFFGLLVLSITPYMTSFPIISSAEHHDADYYMAAGKIHEYFQIISQN